MGGTEAPTDLLDNLVSLLRLCLCARFNDAACCIGVVWPYRCHVELPPDCSASFCWSCLLRVSASRAILQARSLDISETAQIKQQIVLWATHGKRHLWSDPSVATFSLSTPWIRVDWPGFGATRYSSGSQDGEIDCQRMCIALHLLDLIWIMT